MNATSSFYRIFIEPFKALRNRTFAKLFFAQTISLLGDAISWVGLALLAYSISPDRSAVILASALTLRVTAFIIFSPFAGVVADKIDRKKILYITHFTRMGLVCCLPFVTQVWQLYVIIFLLNVFNAFFTPTYRATIPQVTDKDHYREAVGISVAVFQLLGVLGPALAGIVATWLGARDIFFLDAFTFIIAGILILSVPTAALQKGLEEKSTSETETWSNVFKGIKLLFGNRILQTALAIEFVSAIAGANILVNTIGHVKNYLHLGDKEYGYVMAAFGIGAAVAAFLLGSLDKTKTRAISLFSGALVLGTAILLADHFGYYPMLLLWLFAGMGQSLAEMPSETLIGENISSADQGKVYGSHFAFSHLWWAIAYPIAGFLGTNYSDNFYFIAGSLTLVLAVIAFIIFKPLKSKIND